MLTFGCLRRNFAGRSNPMLTLLLLLFVILYIRDHRQLASRETKEQKGKEVNLSQNVMKERRERLISVCEKYQVQGRSEQASIYHRKSPVNRCTGRFFNVGDKDHFICNVLKGGSTSWKFFLGENNITSSLIDECRVAGNCPPQVGLRIVQVRHPLERLLATWRHIFRNGGWKTLDQTDSSDGILQRKREELFSDLSWADFVDILALSDQLDTKEEDMEDFSRMGLWLKHHWAPFWYTCGLCSPDLQPDLVLKTESLDRDMRLVVGELQLPGEQATKFPDIRVTGNDDNFSEGNRPSEEFITKYYSQLTKEQVLKLYQFYRLDHEMFDYSPEVYINIAK